MEEKSFRNYKFILPMYNWPIDLYYGDQTAVQEFIESKYNMSFDTFDRYCNGYTAMMEKNCSKFKELNMFFFISSDDNKFSKSAGENAVHTIHHEAIHTAWFILDNAGIKLSEDNHEALTYLSGYIAQKVYDKILEWKK